MTLYIAAILVLLLTVPAPLPQDKGIRAIDFKNFTYVWNPGAAGSRVGWQWIRSAPETFQLVNGRHSFQTSDSSKGERPATIFLESVTYGDLLGDSSEEAAVWLNYSEGGTSNWSYLYVYKLDRSEPKLLAWLQAGDRAYGGLIRAAIEHQQLVLDFNDSDRRAGVCCSEGYIRVHYAWRNERFVEPGPRERGDLKLNDR